MDRTLDSKLLRIACFSLIVLVGGTSLSGCREKGPFEEAGEEIEDAVEDTIDEIDDAI